MRWSRASDPWTWAARGRRSGEPPAEHAIWVRIGKCLELRESRREERFGIDEIVCGLSSAPAKAALFRLSRLALWRGALEEIGDAVVVLIELAFVVGVEDQ